MLANEASFASECIPVGDSLLQGEDLQDALLSRVECISAQVFSSETTRQGSDKLLLSQIFDRQGLRE